MDMEKVIVEIEDALSGNLVKAGNVYKLSLYRLKDKALIDALALLKEQEAKPMIENERGWNCPSCGMKLIGKTASGYPCDLIDLPLNFCPRCGQEVKWE